MLFESCGGGRFDSVCGGGRSDAVAIVTCVRLRQAGALARSFAEAFLGKLQACAASPRHIRMQLYTDQSTHECRIHERAPRASDNPLAHAS